MPSVDVLSHMLELTVCAHVMCHSCAICNCCDTQIGIAINGQVTLPRPGTPDTKAGLTQAQIDTAKMRDAAAAQRDIDFNFGWFSDAIYLGDYPQSMKDRVLNGRLPAFTADEKATLIRVANKQFFALNFYTTSYAYVSQVHISAHVTHHTCCIIAHSHHVDGLHVPAGQPECL